MKLAAFLILAVGVVVIVAGVTAVALAKERRSFVEASPPRRTPRDFGFVLCSLGVMALIVTIPLFLETYTK